MPRPKKRVPRNFTEKHPNSMFQSKMKLRQRFIAIASLTIVGFFVLLVIETELHIMNKLPEDANSVNGNQHPVLQRRFLNREETSKVSGEAANNVIGDANKSIRSSSTVAPQGPTTTVKPRDNYTDLFKYSVRSPNFRQLVNPPSFVLPKENPTLQEVLKIEPRENFTNWEKFHLQINRFGLYPENSQVVEDMLHDIATQKIAAVEQLPGGTQIKLIITFENGGQALFKPMRFPRETETLPDHFYFTDYERHHSEIASYHLDKLLGFRRAPPVVGRTLNITTEIYALADEELLKTFFISPAGNICFHGQCTYYCDTAHAVCGHPDTLEGSFAAFLPPKTVLSRHPVRSPWRRSYNKRKKASWEGNDGYCHHVKKTAPYDHGRRLYDLMDMAAFDFLTGNMDRHHWEEILLFGNNSAPIHWDHGRGFGRAYHDEISIITPVLQCCVFRLSTFNRFYELHTGPHRLSELIVRSMSKDPVAPVLSQAHLDALDRRVGMVLQALRKCLHFNKAETVFLDDLP